MLMPMFSPHIIHTVSYIFEDENFQWNYTLKFEYITHSVNFKKMHHFYKV